MIFVLRYDFNTSNHPIFIKYNKDRYKCFVYRELFRFNNKLYFHFREQYPKIKNIFLPSFIRIKLLLSIIIFKTIPVIDRFDKSILKLINKHFQIVKSIVKTISVISDYVFKRKKYI